MFSEAGHRVFIGTRSPEEKSASAFSSAVQIGNYTEASAWAEVIVLAFPYLAASEVLPPLRGALAKKS
ncbi:MAG: NAD(P)-binding domain-containing protein [Bacteroidia bacterium]|nr:NAD(P)-binding domain-containing protein [Bacteroidia bacterium]